MKRIMLLALAFSLLGAQGAKADASPLIYRITDGDGHILYLFGTIHMGSQDMYPLGGAVESACRAADALAVEADMLAMPSDLQSRYAAAMRYPLGDSARNHLSRETYALGMNSLDTPSYVLDRLRPVAWSALAEEKAYARLGYSAAWGVDTVLLQRFHEEGKEIMELEGVQRQIDIMLSLPDSVHDADIRRMLGDTKKNDMELEAIVDAWRAGDTKTLEKYVLPQYDQYPLEAVQDYRQYVETLFYERNRAFVRQAAQWIQSGKTCLMAVGAGHVFGDQGVAALLRDMGCQVEAMQQ